MAVEITSGGTVTLSDTDIVCSIVSTTVDDFGFIKTLLKETNKFLVCGRN